MLANKKCNHGPAAVGWVYAVPIGNERIGLVVVAGSDGMGLAFGYFFSYMKNDVRNMSDFGWLRPSSAVILKRFSDLGICKREWTRLGNVPNFDQTTWPIPTFLHKDEPAQLAFARYYDPQSLLFTHEEAYRIDDPRVNGMPSDGLAGYKLMEKVLAKMKEGPFGPVQT